MTFRKYIASALTSLALITCLGAATIFADTIRLKDGTVIRGEIVGFRDQQFTVLIGRGAGGRRSRITLYMEDVDSIEFDSAANSSRTTGTDNSAISSDTNNNSIGGNNNRNNNNDSYSSLPADSGSTGAGNSYPSNTGTATNTGANQSVSQPSSRTQAAPTFFQINTRVHADNTTNGWTNSGLVVRRGQRIRVTASGRVSLGQGRYSTPTGLPTVPDRDKLMRNEPTGELIAVIGDNNDEFIPVGRTREFTAQREGVLFFGVNEGNLNDNSGVYDVVIEAEATSGGTINTP